MVRAGAAQVLQLTILVTACWGGNSQLPDCTALSTLAQGLLLLLAVANNLPVFAPCTPRCDFPRTRRLFFWRQFARPCELIHRRPGVMGERRGDGAFTRGGPRRRPVSRSGHLSSGSSAILPLPHCSQMLLRHGCVSCCRKSPGRERAPNSVTRAATIRFLGQPQQTKRIAPHMSRAHAGWQCASAQRVSACTCGLCASLDRLTR